MTYSIVARDPKTGHLGISVASRFFAVGANVPWIETDAGAIASQAFLNPTYGKRALTMLREGKAPQVIVSTLSQSDDNASQRQFHLISAKGENAAFTGENCIDWAGHLVADGVSVAGNMLVGAQVIGETLKAYKAAIDKPFVERLLLAMQAGEDAGGDKRGKQSASLIVFKGQDYPWLDIRADDHADPLEELRRLYEVAQERYFLFAETMATRQNPHGMLDRREIDEKIAAIEAKHQAEGTKSKSFATPL